jgi:hypothetical protein
MTQTRMAQSNSRSAGGSAGPSVGQSAAHRSIGKLQSDV